MKTFFIFNNLKVNTFLPDDSTIPGFNLIAWDSEAWTYGTLLDIGSDAAFSPIGHTKVRGQLWYAEKVDAIEELEYFAGVKSGFVSKIEVPVIVECKDDFIKEELKAITFAINEIKDTKYEIVNNGNWYIKKC